jgi:hypothetical protein
MMRAARQLGAEVITAYETEFGDVNFYLVGNKNSPLRIWLTHGHEDEIAGKYAIATAFIDLLKNGRYRDEILDKALLIFQPLDDPKGAELNAWTTVDMNGREFHWPPERLRDISTSVIPSLGKVGLSDVKLLEKLYSSPASLAQLHLARDRMPNVIVDGGTIYRDENGVYGDEIRSDRIWAIQECARELKPNWGVDAHETVRSSLSSLVFGRCGVLSIEDWPISDTLRANIYKTVIKEPIWLNLQTLTSSVPKVREMLKDSLFYQVGEAMMEHVRKRGFKTLAGEHQAYLEAPALWPQIVAIGIGRSIDGPMLRTPKIRLKSSWALNELGTAFYITETFPDEIEERVKQQKAYMEGLIFAVTGVGRE